jgi:hypothetical protein
MAEIGGQIARGEPPLYPQLLNTLTAARLERERRACD